MKNGEDRITLVLTGIFLATLPFDRFYSQIALAGLMLHTLIHLRREKLRSFPWATMLLLSSFFLLNLAGMLWSAEKGQALKDMQRQSAILIFPLLLYFSNLDLLRYKNKLMDTFGYSCCGVIIYLFLNAGYTIAVNDMPVKALMSGYFINHNFSEPIGIHATYLSMYASLSLAWFLLQVLERKKYRYLSIAVVIVLVAGLIQLASRAVLIGTFVFSVTGLLFYVATRKIKFGYGIFFVVLAALTAVGFTRIGSFEQRLVLELKRDLVTTAIEPGYREPRIERWRCAYALVQEAPFFGHGSVMEKNLLREKYYDRHLFNSYLRELNAHNQYLSIWIKWGIMGLLIFLVTLALAARKAVQARDPVFFAFLVLVSVVSFSENILDVNKGIFFYAFFLPYFWQAGKPLGAFRRFEGKTGPGLNP